MTTLKTDLSSYLRDVLHIEAAVDIWPHADALPAYFAARYTLGEMWLLGTRCLVMLDRSHGEATPAEIAKQAEALEARTGVPCIYVDEAITPFNRQRLIAKGVQFVVPHNQMYLPRLGLDLRERFKPRKTRKIDVLGASAQATLIHCLLHRHGEAINPSMLAASMGYTAMTATRVISEFTAAELGREHAEGRKRCFVFGAEKPVIWERAKPLLRSPVKRCFHALRTPENGGMGLLAGLSALAQVTMLTEPGTETRAIARAEAQHIGAPSAAQKGVDSGPDILRFEVWNYDPQPLATGQSRRVDPLSLYLSLQDEHDERVEAALEQMMSTLAW
jgi:hypothetical protein